jgi:hypothetical protein
VLDLDPLIKGAELELTHITSEPYDPQSSLRAAVISLRHEVCDERSARLKSGSGSHMCIAERLRSIDLIAELYSRTTRAAAFEADA